MLNAGTKLTRLGGLQLPGFRISRHESLQIQLSFLELRVAQARTMHRLNSDVKTRMECLVRPFASRAGLHSLKILRKQTRKVVATGLL